MNNETRIALAEIAGYYFTEDTDGLKRWFYREDGMEMLPPNTLPLYNTSDELSDMANKLGVDQYLVLIGVPIERHVEVLAQAIIERAKQ